MPITARPGRSIPVHNPSATVRRQEADILSTPISALLVAGAFSAFCSSKRILLGAKIYPFAGLDYIGDFDLQTVTWRSKRDNDAFGVMQNVDVGNFTDILAATRFVSQTITEFGMYLYEIVLTNEFNAVTELELNIICNVIAGSSKNVQRDLTFKPFSDFMIAIDPTQIKSVRYELSGDVIIPQTSIERQVLFSGTHELDANAAYLFDGRRNYKPCEH